jgi:hypothetical protein
VVVESYSSFTPRLVRLIHKAAHSKLWHQVLGTAALSWLTVRAGPFCVGGTLSGLDCNPPTPPFHPFGTLWVSYGGSGPVSDSLWLSQLLAAVTPPCSTTPKTEQTNASIQKKSFMEMYRCLHPFCCFWRRGSAFGWPYPGYFERGSTSILLSPKPLLGLCLSWPVCQAGCNRSPSPYPLV